MFNDVALPPTTKLVLLALAEFADKSGGCCYPSHDSIGKLTGLHVRSVRRLLPEAEAAGWIEIGKRALEGRAWRRNAYALRLPEGADLRTARARLRDDAQGNSRVTEGEDTVSSRSAPGGEGTVAARCSRGEDTMSAPSSPTCGHSRNEVRTSVHGGEDTVSSELLKSILGKSSYEGSNANAFDLRDESGTRSKTSIEEMLDDAMTAYNALLAPPAGVLPTAMLPTDARRKGIRRALSTVRRICAELYDSERVTQEFWQAYFETAADDDFHAGRKAGGQGHENWKPDFDFLIRPTVITRLFERAMTDLRKSTSRQVPLRSA